MSTEDLSPVHLLSAASGVSVEHRVGMRVLPVMGSDSLRTMWETAKEVAPLVGLLTALAKGKLPPEVAVASLLAGVTLYFVADAVRRRRIRRQWA